MRTLPLFEELTMNRTGLLPVLLVVSAAIASTGCGQPTTAGAEKSPGKGGSNAARSVERVTAGPPQRKNLTLITTQPASIDAYESTTLSPKVAGYVGEVLIDIGARVTAGQVLLRLEVPEMLDDRRQKEALRIQAQAEIVQAQAKLAAAQAGVVSARARITQAEAAVLRADAALEQYRAESARLSDLASGRSVTQQLADEGRSRLQGAEAGHTEAQAGVELARAVLLEGEAGVAQADADVGAANAREQVAASNLAYVETMLGYLELKAPYDGVITQRNVDTGHFARASTESAQPLLAVARTDRVRVFVDLPEAEASRVTSGESGDSAVVRIQALGGREFAARVSRTGWALDPANRSLRVEIEVDNSDGALRPGMYATASIVLEERKGVLTLPATAVVRQATAAHCCVVRDGVVVRTPIQLGLRVGDDIEVLSGIADDNDVVLIRADGLVDGQTVEVVEPASAR